ncbi:MAG: lytic murein transglycosylase [Bdellovibrio sp.]|nr:MAG: lytic murein transglycosylase [Bdellovibrio sp.]
MFAVVLLPFTLISLNSVTLVSSVSRANASNAGASKVEDCHDRSYHQGKFTAWLTDLKYEALRQGISQQTLDLAAPYMVYDPGIIRKDNNQGIFQSTFLQFSDRLATEDRRTKAILHGKKYQVLFSRIEQRHGVPAPVLLSFWALESDFRSQVGKDHVLTATTTLAFDCRRPDFFRKELLSALRILQNGDIPLEQMVGDWAGELGGLQFTPTDYLLYAVDFDQDGRRDILHSKTDMLATGANFLAHLGWRRGEPWIQEVRLPGTFAWEKTGLEIEQTRTEWVKSGVQSVGSDLPADDLPASLFLPMGHLGPAFLLYHNFKNAYLGWNSAMMYSLTAAYLATRIAGAPAVTADSAALVVPLQSEQLRELQSRLVADGFQVNVDGKLGLETRRSVKKAQLKYGLIADGYPTLELLERLPAVR